MSNVRVGDYAVVVGDDEVQKVVFVGRAERPYPVAILASLYEDGSEITGWTSTFPLRDVRAVPEPEWSRKCCASSLSGHYADCPEAKKEER